MSAGIFQSFQPQYAAHRIATFPVVNKRPAVRGYRFLDANPIAGRRQ
jgi:hypothetical protein